MPTPSNRIPVRVARGNKATLVSLLADLFEGELCYAKDEEALYAVEGGVLVPVVASTGGSVTSVNSLTGAVVLDADDISDATTTNKYTTQADIDKLAGIAPGAEVNVNADWNASSGDAEILNKPAIPAAQVNSDWDATSGVAEILNKPTVPTNNNQLTNGAGYISDITGENLNDLSDVTVTSASNGDVLSYNGAAWVNSAAPPADISGSSIGQLNDVDTSTTSPTTNDVLTWTGTEWEPAASQGGSGITNLAYTASATDGTVTSDTGTDATVPLANGTNAGLLAPGDFTKLGGIAAGAEVNVNADWNAGSGDAQILNKPTLGTAAATDSTAYATAAQGTTADSAIQPGDSKLIPAGGTAGQVLEKIDGTNYNVQWATPSGGGGGGALNDLSDVDTATTAPADTDQLIYDGTNSKWVPQAALVGGGGQGIVVSETTATSSGLEGSSTPYADGTAMGNDGWQVAGGGSAGDFDYNGFLWNSGANLTTQGVQPFGGYVAGMPTLNWEAGGDSWTVISTGMLEWSSGSSLVTPTGDIRTSGQSATNTMAFWMFCGSGLYANTRAVGQKDNIAADGRTWTIIRADMEDIGNSSNAMAFEWWFATDGSVRFKYSALQGSSFFTPAANAQGVTKENAYPSGIPVGYEGVFPSLTSSGDYAIHYDIGTLPSSSGQHSTKLLPADAPTTAAASGTVGEIRFDDTYMYICVATNVWRRVAHATW